ncbi:coiled-coil domain-containing protein 74A [Thalassophryne amazonica]|uniref:coiled-coil domain-containing protein 74A n=1 Tax=Thalassophryne amazonica TaxID=390379 RepID=UPI001470FA39|nr:coiled-coil domain-containing protein 74A [Thalassophryne amazonica]
MSVSSHHFPPIRNLPQWNRVGCLGKSSRRPLLRPLPAPPPPAGRGAVRRAEESSSSSSRTGADPRVSCLERSVQFLQEQHKDTLEKLHAEIDHLRRENKELQYKMIMDSPQLSRKGKMQLQHSQQDFGPPTKGSKVLNGTYPEVPPQDVRRIPDQPLRKGRGQVLKADLITSLHPLRIHSSLSHPPRAPTLPECEDIIRQLSAAHSSQSQEILRVKTLLKEIVLSRKVTPENYVLAKTYLVDGTCKSAEVKNIQKIGLQMLPEKKCGVILPALTQSLSSTIADRQRRIRAIQRKHFKRTLT